MAVTRICVLRRGAEFGPRNVQWLAKQIPGLVCLSDVAIPGVETISLQYNWPGWWAKLELFRPDIDGDLLYFDLDTVITGALEDLDGVGKTTMLSDFYRRELPASGLMYIAQADKAAVWAEFTCNPQQHIDRCTTRDCWGDQGFLRGVLSPLRWQHVLPGKVVSYKAHCGNGLPSETAVVCFHGQPRPWAVNEDWVPAC